MLVKVFFSILKLFRWAFNQNRFQMVILVILSFISGITEGIGITIIIPLFSLASGSQLKGLDIITQTIKIFFDYFNLPFSLKSLLIFVFLLFIIKVMVVALFNYITAYIAATYEYKSRVQLASSMFQADWSYLSKQKIGFLDQILTSDLGNSTALLLVIGNTIPTFINILIYTFIAINISFPVAVLTLVLGGVIFFIFKPLFRRTRDLSEKTSKFYKQMSHYVNESIIGLKTIKSMFVERQIIKRADSYFDQIRKTYLTSKLLSNAVNILVQLIGVIYVVGLFSFFYKTKMFNFASFAVIIYAINKVFSYIQTTQSQLYQIVTLQPFLASVTHYQEEHLRLREVDKGRKKFVFNRELEFRNVYFGYNDKDEILSNISFIIKKGEMAGLIGPSGAGKTTLVDLMLHLYQPQGGAILLDGEEAPEISLAEWRTKIGYVSQDIFLMNDTVENNIRFYNDSFSSEEIIEAAKMANILDVINNLPEKFSTVIGERGIRLSVGQRQRVVLARILIRKPEVLILDEATSALDNESELQIQKVIEGLKSKITVLVIAHRLTTIINCDRLLVLEDGKIIEEGTPQELLKDKDSYFYKVYSIRNQSG